MSLESVKDLCSAILNGSKKLTFTVCLFLILFQLMWRLSILKQCEQLNTPTSYRKRQNRKFCCKWYCSGFTHLIYPCNICKCRPEWELLKTCLSLKIWMG